MAAFPLPEALTHFAFSVVSNLRFQETPPKYPGQLTASHCPSAVPLFTRVSLNEGTESRLGPVCGIQKPPIHPPQGQEYMSGCRHRLWPTLSSSRPTPCLQRFPNTFPLDNLLHTGEILIGVPPPHTHTVGSYI